MKKIIDNCNRMSLKKAIILIAVLALVVPTITTAKQVHDTNDTQPLVGKIKMCYVNGMYWIIVVNGPNGVEIFRPWNLPGRFHQEGMEVVFTGRPEPFDPWPDRLGTFIEITDIHVYIEKTGKVVFVPLEGGFWGIRGDDGWNYDTYPYNSIPPEYRKPGLPCSFSGAVLEGQPDYHDWGYLVRLMSFESHMFIEHGE